MGRKPERAARKTQSASPRSVDAKAVQTPAHDARGKIRRRRDGAELARVHAWIPVEMERQLARYCVDQRREKGEVVAEALSKLLGRSKGRAA